MKKERKRKNHLSQLWKLNSRRILSQHRQWDFGYLNFIVAIIIFSVGILHLFQISNADNTPMEKYLEPAILFLLSFLVYFASTKHVISFIFLILGLGVLLDPKNISDLSTAIFFIFAFHMVRNTKYGIFLYLVNLLGSAYRSHNVGMTTFQSLGMFIGFTFLYACYYLIIYRQIEKPASIKIDDLSETENKLLSGLASGQSQKTTIANMGLSQSQGYDTVKKIKEKMNSDSMDEIMFNLGSNKYSKIRQ